MRVLPLIVWFETFSEKLKETICQIERLAGSGKAISFHIFADRTKYMLSLYLAQRRVQT